MEIYILNRILEIYMEYRLVFNTFCNSLNYLFTTRSENSLIRQFI